MRWLSLALVALSVGSLGLVAAAQSRPGRGGSGEHRAPGAPPPASTARTAERTEGASKVKVYRFGEIDISGRLRSPQLLYFMNRARSEFRRTKLPHRSFIPELRAGARDKAL